MDRWLRDIRRSLKEFKAPRRAQPRVQPAAIVPEARMSRQDGTCPPPTDGYAQQGICPP
jgi:hypothetical protein